MPRPIGATPVRFGDTIYIAARDAADWFQTPNLSIPHLQALRAKGEGPRAYKLIDGQFRPFDQYPNSTASIHYKLNDVLTYIRTGARDFIDYQNGVIAAAEAAVERAIEFVNAPDANELQEVACENCGDKFLTDNEHHWCSVGCAEPYLNSAFFELENGFGSELPKFKGYTLSTCATCGSPQYEDDDSDDVFEGYCSRCIDVAYAD